MRFRFALFAACCLAFVTSSANAQFWPGYGYGSDAAGVWGSVVAARRDATLSTIHQQERDAGQRMVAQRSAAVQADAFHTLSTQADMRARAALGQQQSNRDWWFQVQQQQMAQRRAMPTGSIPPAEVPFSPAAMLSQTPAVETDIIAWPPLLREPRFAEARAAVEAPYRRAPAGQAVPTIKDYETMIRAVETMKQLLGEMTAEVSAQQYLDTEKFLSQLADEARGRIEKQ